MRSGQGPADRPRHLTVKPTPHPRPHLRRAVSVTPSSLLVRPTVCLSRRCSAPPTPAPTRGPRLTDAFRPRPASCLSQRPSLAELLPSRSERRCSTPSQTRTAGWSRPSVQGAPLLRDPWPASAEAEACSCWRPCRARSSRCSGPSRWRVAGWSRRFGHGAAVVRDGRSGEGGEVRAGGWGAHDRAGSRRWGCAGSARLRRWGCWRPGRARSCECSGPSRTRGFGLVAALLARCGRCSRRSVRGVERLGPGAAVLATVAGRGSGTARGRAGPRGRSGVLGRGSGNGSDARGSKGDAVIEKLLARGGAG